MTGRGIVIWLIIIGLGVGAYFHFVKGRRSSKVSNVEVAGDRMTVTVENFVANFTAQGEFTQRYMVFGGAANDRKDAINKITITGLDIYNAQRIYADYPDFHKCSSKGSSLAKNMIRQLDIVPLDSEVLNGMLDSLDLYRKNLQEGGDQVCLSLGNGPEKMY